MKRIHSVMVCAAVSIVLSGVTTWADATTGKKPVEVDYNDIKVTLDGTNVTLADANGNLVEPFVIDGTTYLPVRAISSALGLEVGWDGETSTVILSTPKEEKRIYITRTGSKYHYDQSCNGGTYWEVPYSTAVGFGLTPCDKCVRED